MKVNEEDSSGGLIGHCVSPNRGERSTGMQPPAIHINGNLFESVDRFVYLSISRLGIVTAAQI